MEIDGCQTDPEILVLMKKMIVASPHKRGTLKELKDMITQSSYNKLTSSAGPGRRISAISATSSQTSFLPILQSSSTSLCTYKKAPFAAKPRRKVPVLPLFTFTGAF